MIKKTTLNDLLDRSLIDSDFRKILYTKPELIIKEYPELNPSDKQQLLNLKIEATLIKK